MPNIRYYTVTQEREVKVTANNPTDAVIVADAVFRELDPPEDVWGSASSAIRDRDIVAREDY